MKKDSIILKKIIKNQKKKYIKNIYYSVTKENMAQECKINFTLKTSIIHHINRIKEKKHNYFNRCGKKN